MQSGYCYFGKAVGTMKETKRDLGFECHLDGDELMIGYFYAVPVA